MSDDDDDGLGKRSSERRLGFSLVNKSMPFDYLKLIEDLDEDSKKLINVTTDDLGQTAMHYASLATNPDHVSKLLKYGASVNVMDKDGMSPFLNAVSTGYKLIVKPILESNANILTVHKRTGNTALHIAILNWNAILAEMLIDKGVNVNQPNKRGLSPLHLAVNQRDLTMTELLLERGAKVNSLDKNGETALYKAVLTGDRRLVRMLINKGSFMNTQRHSSKPEVGPSSSCSTVPFRPKSPLHAAVLSGNVAILDLLLQRCAWIDARDDRGFTPLQCAVECGNDTIVNRLITKGAAVLEISEWLVNKCRDDLGDPVKTTVMKHLIKLKMVNLFPGDIAFDNNTFDELNCQCSAELEKSRSFTLFKGVVFDVFHPSLSLASQNEIEQLKRVLDNPLIESEFPLFISVMKAKVAQLKLRFLLISKGFLFFVILFKLNPIHRVPPKPAMLKIFKCLSNIDMQNMLVFCENTIAKEIK